MLLFQGYNSIGKKPDYSMAIKDTFKEWEPLQAEFRKDYMRALSARLRAERVSQTVYPQKEHVFRAYSSTALKDVKAVLLGMDPYPTNNYANGLAFSVFENTFKNNPKSLDNIFTELENDVGFQPYHNPDLERWAKQGVMLLNTTLTVREGQPGSHTNFGWKTFTNNTLYHICKRDTPTVFMLWGRHAHAYGNLIPTSELFHCLYAPHPSPLSAYRGFFGCRHFSQCNEFLEKHNLEPIDWLKNE